MQQLYKSKQQHGSKYIIQIANHSASIASKSNIHDLINSYITHKLHKIIINNLNHHVSSSQIILNFSKSPRSYPRVISQGYMRLQVANRTGFWVLTQLAMASGNARLASNLGLARYGELECSPRELQGTARYGELGCSPRERSRSTRHGELHSSPQASDEQSATGSAKIHPKSPKFII